MPIIRSLVGVTLLACALFVHAAETAYYPSAFAQSPELTLDMPVGSASLTLPEEVTAAFFADGVMTTWSTEYRDSRSSYLRLDATPDNPYDDAPGSLLSYSLVDGTRKSWFAVVEAGHRGQASVELLVGSDLNGDGLPQAQEELCRARADAFQTPRCLLDLRLQTAHPLWAIAHIVRPSGMPYFDGESVSVSIATADFIDSGQQTHTRPSTYFESRSDGFSNGTAWRREFSYGPDPEHAVDDPFRAIGGLLITHSGQSQADPLVFPIRLDITPSVKTDQGRALAARYDAFDEVKIDLQPGEIYNGLYADNPGQDLLELVVLNPEVQVMGWQAPFPASSADSRAIATPPAPNQTVFFLWPGALPGAPNSLQVCEGCPTNQRIVPGRIRFSVQNMNRDSPVSVRIRLRLSRTADFATRQLPGLTSPGGNYYNPLRSGDGVFLDYAAGQLIFYWYTFDKEGQPVWYTTSAQPSYDNGAVGTMNAPLYRISRFGIKDRSPVGRIVLTAAESSSRELMFSWSIDGISGTNRLHWAYPPRCTQQVPSTRLNITGHWFDTSAPGWGTNLLGLPHALAEGLYFFDAYGAPRWVFGSLAQSGSAWNGAMYQFKGACPTCDYVAPVLTAVGEATLAFLSDDTAIASYSVQLAAPLRGSFVQTRADIERATTAVECSAP